MYTKGIWFGRGDEGAWRVLGRPRNPTDPAEIGLCVDRVMRTRDEADRVRIVAPTRLLDTSRPHCSENRTAALAELSKAPTPSGSAAVAPEASCVAVEASAAPLDDATAVTASVVAEVTFRDWLIHYPGRAPVDAVSHPSVTCDEILELFAGVVAAVPTPEPIRRSTTVAETAELRALIQAVLADTPDEWDERHRIAYADPDSALISWRSLVVGMPPIVPPFPDPPTCRQCLNLSRCRKPPQIDYAASRGTLTSPPYDLAMDVGLRCGGYRPSAADPDQRPAWERWPELPAWRRV